VHLSSKDISVQNCKFPHIDYISSLIVSHISILPIQVQLEDIEEMFSYADQDCDGKISWSEFQTMINPPKPPELPKPTLADLAVKVKMEKL
jgi:hypothetical protein